MNGDRQELILVVDDNPTNIKVLFDLLQTEGYRVLVAKSGESALEKLQAVSPDLILLDVMMQGMSGFETCRRLKASEEIGDIPVIFMTALSDVEDKVKAFSLGAVDYITKPFQQEEVLARVNIHLKLRNLNKELEKRVLQRTSELSAALEQVQKSQLQLVQNEKMSALGQLVAGIAHEINNPVGFIRGNLTHAESYVRDLIEHLQRYRQRVGDPDLAAHAEEIDLEYLLEDLPKVIASMQEGVERICNISVSLRTFSREDDRTKVTFNIHEGIDSTLLILKHRLRGCGDRPDIIVIKDYGNIPPIECFPSQLNQVFMNLLANAIDSLEEADKKFGVDRVAPNYSQISIQTMLSEDKNHVLIRILDNGIGISEAVKPKIFEHLFTTKPIGKGTGLGLAIANQIVVEKHGGTIEVNSITGQGAEFQITLPIK